MGMAWGVGGWARGGWVGERSRVGALASPPLRSHCTMKEPLRLAVAAASLFFAVRDAVCSFLCCLLCSASSCSRCDVGPWSGPVIAVLPLPAAIWWRYRVRAPRRRKPAVVGCPLQSWQSLCRLYATFGRVLMWKRMRRAQSRRWWTASASGSPASLASVSASLWTCLFHLALLITGLFRPPQTLGTPAAKAAWAGGSSGWRRRCP